MSMSATLAGLALAALAMFGLGVPLAWLFPAPADAQWVHRIAIAPLFAIAVATPGAWLLGASGLALAPWQLVVLGAPAWWLAWRRAGPQWDVRQSLRLAAGPVVIVALAGLSWALSMLGFGLYLPNRDFKNHAYFVAQVASSRSSDVTFVLRGSPVLEDPESANFYPLGLHTLLGWALPHPDGNTVAITAAAAVLASAVSGSLALVVLGRMWDPASKALWWSAGVAAAFIPSLVGAFTIGSVVILAGTALFSAALASLWLWQSEPTVPTSTSLAVCGLGLFFLHVAEAVGLALVACALVPSMLSPPARRLNRRWVLALGGGLVVLVAATFNMAKGLVGLLDSGFEWDLVPNEESMATAMVSALVQQPGGAPGGTVLWLTLGIAGFWVACKRGAAQFLLVAFLVPVGLAVFASARVTPSIINLLTAPWYGSASRITLLASAPLVLAGCYFLVSIVDATRGRAARSAWQVVAVVCIGALAVQIVPGRRSGMRASLAGAGDTARVAATLATTLEPGQTVLNLEDDGSANLFAYARVPVLSGLDDSIISGPELEPPLKDQLLNLSDARVADRLRDLGVAYIALGTTSRYWGDGVGYPWQLVASQPEVQLEFMGSDVVILRYAEGAR